MARGGYFRPFPPDTGLYSDINRQGQLKKGRAHPLAFLYLFSSLEDRFLRTSISKCIGKGPNVTIPHTCQSGAQSRQSL